MEPLDKAGSIPAGSANAPTGEAQISIAKRYTYLQSGGSRERPANQTKEGENMDEHGVVTLTIREEDVMVQLKNENELLREAVADAARQVEFLTAECMA